jgi:hypothetical protein
MTLKTFAPSGADTVQLSATAASSRVAVDSLSSVVRVLNAGPNTAYLQFGDGSVSSTTAKMPIPVGSTELFTKGSATNVAAICDTGNTAVLYFTPGEGI